MCNHLPVKDKPKNWKSWECKLCGLRIEVGNVVKEKKKIALKHYFYRKIYDQAGIHPKVVSERLGHASVAFTLDTYSHAVPAMHEEAAERLGAVVWGASHRAPLR